MIHFKFTFRTYIIIKKYYFIIVTNKQLNRKRENKNREILIIETQKTSIKNGV